MQSRLYPRLFCALLTLIFLLAQVTPARHAQEGDEARSAINAYAITNARIVTVSGALIERGTLVIRNGLISAVGGSAVAPADARVIDGTGLTVYPGLIDCSSSLGIPVQASTTSRPADTGATVVSAAAPNSTQPVGLRPEILAADLIEPGSDQLEA